MARSSSGLKALTRRATSTRRPAGGYPTMRMPLPVRLLSTASRPRATKRAKVILMAVLNPSLSPIIATSSSHSSNTRRMTKPQRPRATPTYPGLLLGHSLTPCSRTSIVPHDTI